MPLYRPLPPKVRPPLFTRPKQPRKGTKAKARRDDIEEQIAGIKDWWAQHHGALVRNIAKARPESVKQSVGGAWVSKRALYMHYLDFAQGSYSVANWHRFLMGLQDLMPRAKTRSYELKYFTFSGLLLNRWSEVHVWFTRGDSQFPVE